MTTNAPGPLPTEFPEAGTELESLHGALERNRRTLAWKCGGLDDAAMRTTLGPSSITLAGLLKHLAFLEDFYFTTCLWGQDLPEPWQGVDFDEHDWEWRSALEQGADELRALWRDACSRSRASIAQSLQQADGLDTVAAYSPWPTKPNLRRMVVDMVEEYARHTGHADLIRESIDGLVGEDAPHP